MQRGDRGEVMAPPVPEALRWPQTLWRGQLVFSVAGASSPVFFGKRGCSPSTPCKGRPTAPGVPCGLQQVVSGASRK